MSNEMFMKIMLSVISLCGAIITGILIPYIKSKIGDSKFERLLYYVSVAVRCAEQIYTPEQWEEKKKYVMDYCMKLINEKLNINVTYNDLDIIVEGIVNEIKHPNGKEIELFEG